MNRAAFEHLNQACSVVSATWFRQRSLARLHSLPQGFGLCAALVEAWWTATRDGHAVDALHSFEDVERMTALIRRQCNTAYLSESIGQDDLRSDLEAAYGMGIRQCVSWSECRNSPPVLTKDSDGSGLRLLLLRYGSTGHRMAFVVSPKGSVRFFDPNAGEVMISSAERFGEWFEAFWTAAGYAARQPSVTLFCFRPHEQEAISSHGS